VSCRQDNEIHVIATDYEGQKDRFEINSSIESHPMQLWSNYVRGVIRTLIDENYSFTGINMAIVGNVPQGAGLSSSASLEVAVGQAVKEAFQLDISQLDIARVGQRAENEFVGCQCGIMDQLISAKGLKDHALLIDCRSLETEQGRTNPPL